MGMYDTIGNELWCPFCGVKIKRDEFQTKNFHKGLDSLDILKLRGVYYNIYTQCLNCWNEIELHIDSHGIHTFEEGQRLKEKRKKQVEKLLNS